jgi:hypothetical protein
VAKKNLIFLDFDGVLNSERSNYANNSKYQTHSIGWEPEGLDEVAVRLVRRLSEEGEADVVISSSWRHFFPLKQLEKFLASKGWNACPIIGQTPSLRARGMYDLTPAFGGTSFRGNEIGSFLKDFVENGNELGNWVILDDGKDFHYGETSLGGFYQNQPVVNTCDLIGFSIVDFYEALKILSPEHQLLDQLAFLIRIPNEKDSSSFD